jgi:hypothetical protein
VQRFDAGEVRDPQRVRFGGVELPVDHIQSGGGVPVLPGSFPVFVQVSTLNA